MNKIALGGILVTMAGGIPGATYLLTRDSEDKNTSLREEDTARTEDVQVPERKAEDCGDGKTCPQQSPLVAGSRENSETGPSVPGAGA